MPGKLSCNSELPRFWLKNIAINAIGFEGACAYIIKLGRENRAGYVCVSNARTVYLANHDETFSNIQNSSTLTVPDGIPLVWLGRRLGYNDVERVTGPDLMIEILNQSDEHQFSHFFYGGSATTIEKIESRIEREYPALDLKGALSPPFQPIEAFDIDALASKLNELKPTFFWCGLGAPKQETLISRLAPKLEQTLCIGVGLAFDYFAGLVCVPPSAIKKMKLEWLYRNLQQPSNFRRFAGPFFETLLMLMKVNLTGKV